MRQRAPRGEARGGGRPPQGVREAVRRQHEDPEEHDRSLIAERLAWTPDERLEANAGFVR